MVGWEKDVLDTVLNGPEKRTYIGLASGLRLHAFMKLLSASWDITLKLKAYGKENPLKHLAIIIWVGDWVKPELVLLVVMLSEIEKDSSSLEDCEVVTGVVNYCGNPSIRVDFDEPRFLH